MNENYTTLKCIGGWTILITIIAWIHSRAQADWTFYIVVASFAILVLGIVIRFSQVRFRKRQVEGIEVRYLIPQQTYPRAVFKGAPNKEKRVSKLTVGIGTYKILHRLVPKVSMLVDEPAFYFDGQDENKPKVFGIDNPYKVEGIQRTDGAYYRDWWGNVQRDASAYPKYYHHGNVYAMGNRIQTFGKWIGKCVIEIPVRDEKVLTFKMDFEVTDNPELDNIPFLKVVEESDGSIDLSCHA